nr:hypothetical protein CFP56_51881 [Quercus suber]
MKRKIINEVRCEHCKEQKEDVIHALYQCPKLQDLWSKNERWNHSSLKQATSFIDLIGYVFADNRNPDLFSMVAWAIWNRRNNLRLGKVAASLDELLSQSLDRIRDFKLNNSSLATTVGRPPTRWQAPDQDTYKVNFDGALFSEANTASSKGFICWVGIPRSGRFVVNSEVGVEGSWRVKGLRMLGVGDLV